MIIDQSYEIDYLKHRSISSMLWSVIYHTIFTDPYLYNLLMIFLFYFMEYNICCNMYYLISGR